MALGALVGAPARHLVGQALPRPWGTLAVNLAGSLLLGLLVGLAVSGSALALLGAGLCGAFTTASAFAWEAVELGRRAAAYVLASVLGGTALAAVGLLAGRALSG